VRTKRGKPNESLISEGGNLAYECEEGVEGS